MKLKSVLSMIVVISICLLTSCSDHSNTADDPLLIGKSAGHYISPKYSPDGQHIAYLFNDQLYVVDAKGRHKKKLTGSFFNSSTSVSAVSWISDEQLAYVETKDNDTTPIVTLRKYDFSTGEKSLIKSGLHSSDNISWNPTNKNQAAIVMDTSESVLDPGYRLVYLLDLVNSKLEMIQGLPQDVHITQSLWFPDGRNLAIVQEKGDLIEIDTKTNKITPFKQDSVASLSFCNGDKFIYRVVPNRTNGYIGGINIGSSDFQSASEKFIDFDMSSFDCSPDGKTIVYTTVGKPGKNQLKLYKIN
jgi:dipeptidyl aminopeptidase/acylaminoacyl peptidase